MRLVCLVALITLDYAEANWSGSGPGCAVPGPGSGCATLRRGKHGLDMILYVNIKF